MNCILRTIVIFKHILEYYGLVNSILEYNNNMDFNTPICNMIYPVITENVSLLLEEKKGCNKTYQNIVRNCLQPTSQNKWNIKLNLSINFEWRKVYNLPYMITKDCNLRWFQYKLVNRILASIIACCPWLPLLRGGLCRSTEYS